MTCRETPFVKEPTGIKIIKSTSDCCEDIAATALVYYNALYCHPASASFSALPTGLLPPCAEIGDPNAPPLDVEPPNPDDPPVSNPPPVTPPPDEPPPVLPPDDPPDDPLPPVDLPPEIPLPPDFPAALRAFAPATAADFKTLLTNSLPGDYIAPVPGVYAFGNYTLTTKLGTALNPIIVDGQNGLVTITCSSVENFIFTGCAHIQFINNVKFLGGANGPKLENCSYIVFEFDSGSMQKEGIIVKNSNHIWLQHFHVHDTGLGTPNNGQGVLVFDSSYAVYIWDFTTDHTTAEPIDIDDATTQDCVISGPARCFGTNTLYVPGIIESLIALNGVHHVVDGVSLIRGAPHGITINGGSDHIVRNCAADVQNIHSFPGTRYAYNVVAGTDVIIACSNVAQNGTFSNVTCTDENVVVQPPSTDVVYMVLLDVPTGTVPWPWNLLLNIAYGPRIVTVPSGGVLIAVGANWQTVVNAHPAGTVYIGQTGSHIQQTVLAKNGDSFIGQPGCVMDGQDITLYAFTRLAGNPDNITIRGIRMTRYVGVSASGPINAGDFPADATNGWILEDCEVDHSHNLGVRLGNNMLVRYNNLHHNATLGIGGVGTGCTVEFNIIAYNNFGTSNPDSGGTKFVLSQGITVRYNNVHHNNGPGIWFDIGDRDYICNLNWVHDNVQEGIVPEICYNGEIKDNLVQRNGLTDTRSNSWLWGAGIGIHASGGTGLEVAHNYLQGNRHGIAEIQQARGTNHADPAGVDAEMYVQNVWVHDNIDQRNNEGTFKPTSGAVTDTGFTAIYTSRNNRWQNNHYIVPRVNTAPFAWNNAIQTYAQWLVFGHDATGTMGEVEPLYSSTKFKTGPTSIVFEIPIGAPLASQHAQIFLNAPATTMGAASGHFTSGFYSSYIYPDAGYLDTGSNVLIGWLTGVEGAHSPIGHVGLEFRNGVLQLMYQVANGTVVPVMAGYTVSGSAYYQSSASPAGIKAFPFQQQVHICIHYVMAVSGSVTIWQDGIKVMELTGINTLIGISGSNAAGDMTLQFGIGGSVKAHTYRVYFDDFQVTNYQVVPVVTPVPPPPVTTLRYPRGVWTQNYAYGEPLIDIAAQNPGGFPAKLQQARTNGKRIAFKLFAGYASQKAQGGDPELSPSNVLYDPTMVVGGWSQRRAKQQVSNAHNLMGDVRSYVTDGTFIAHILGDDIESGAKALWNGRIPTGAELEDLARHSKSVTGWSTLPCTYRLTADYLKKVKPIGGYQYLDFAWNQLPFGGTTDIYGFCLKAYNDALSINLGIMIGGNLLDGGAGPNSPDGWAIRGNRQDKYGLSPTEIGKLGDAIQSLGDFKTLGCFFWTDLSYYPPGGTQAQLLAYFNRSEIQAALTNFSNKVKNVKLGPINYR